MKLRSTTVRGSHLLSLVFLLAVLPRNQAAGAQAPTLSRITAQQIAEILKLPADLSIYEPPAECDDPTNQKCSGMDRTKKLFTVSDDGSVQLNECGEMRLFRFTGLKHLNLVAGLCRQGRFVLPELNETKSRAQRVIEFFIKDVARLNPDPTPMARLGDVRTVSIDASGTAHIFMVLWFGHGVGFLPTAVVTRPGETATLVLQLLIVPDDRGPFMANLLPKSIEVMESLVRGLYPAMR